MNRNNYPWIFTVVFLTAAIYCQPSNIQDIICLKKQDCPSKGTTEQNSECYNNICYDSPGVCVFGKCPEGNCVNNAEKKEVCITKRTIAATSTTVITTTTSTTTTTTTPECHDLVGPNGKSNCPEVAYLCNVGLYRSLMRQQCPKTCGLCNETGCTDKTGPNGVSNCAEIEYLCRHRYYRDLMRQQCPKTCGYCGRPGCADKVGPDGFSTCPQLYYLCHDRRYHHIMFHQCPATCGRC